LPIRGAGSGHISPVFVVLCIGGFAMMILIMGANWFATRPRK
jgi:hypothetical protein